jgi:hypothetical protein
MQKHGGKIREARLGATAVPKAQIGRFDTKVLKDVDPPLGVLSRGFT